MKINEGFVLITGAGSGLGKSLAINFARKNYPVVLVGRTISKLASVASECKGAEVLCISADISKYKEVEKCFDQANNWKKFPAIVISCAGEGLFGRLGSYRDEHINKAFSGSLTGTILVSQRAFTDMRDKGGIIMNIISTSALVGRNEESLYCAAKWGARGFTEALREEAKGTDVKVISVFPGGMKTPFWNESCGRSTNTDSFIDPDELAENLINNLLASDSFLIEEMVIRRK